MPEFSVTGRARLVQRPGSPEITFNEWGEALEQASNYSVEWDIPDTGDIVATQTEMVAGKNHKLTGTPASDFTFGLPAVNSNGDAFHRHFFVTNDTDKTATIYVDGGYGASVDVYAGATAELFSDGTDITAYTPTVVLPFTYYGQPPPLEIINGIDVAVPLTFPIGLAGSHGRVKVAPASDADFDLQVDILGGTPTSIGTVHFAAGEEEATFTFLTEYVVDRGDIVELVAPDPQDASLEDVLVSLVATKAF